MSTQHARRMVALAVMASALSAAAPAQAFIGGILGSPIPPQFMMKLGYDCDAAFYVYSADSDGDGVDDMHNTSCPMSNVGDGGNNELIYHFQRENLNAQQVEAAYDACKTQYGKMCIQDQSAFDERSYERFLTTQHAKVKPQEEEHAALSEQLNAQ